MRENGTISPNFIASSRQIGHSPLKRSVFGSAERAIWGVERDEWRNWVPRRHTAEMPAKEGTTQRDHNWHRHRKRPLKHWKNAIRTHGSFSRNHKAGMLRWEFSERWLFVVAGSTSQPLAPKCPFMLKKCAMLLCLCSMQKPITNSTRNCRLLLVWYVGFQS